MLNIWKVFKIVKKKIRKISSTNNKYVNTFFFHLKMYVALQRRVGQIPLLVRLGGEASEKNRIDDD